MGDFQTPQNTQMRLLSLLALTGTASAGPFPLDPIAAADSRFASGGWAIAAEITRGPSNIAAAAPIAVTYGVPEDAIGPADATPDQPYPVVSLGDGGNAILTFAAPFSDVPGPDFVVYENSFSASFLELAHVEVSSDGINYFRFPSTSLTVAAINIGNGGTVDPTDIRNLAGKYGAGFGTPFDLAEMRRFSPELDPQRITHVRILDAVGTNDPAFASFDAMGTIIIDPYPTNFFSGGFDLDAVGTFSTTATTFLVWLTAHGYTGPDALPDADPDHNGIPNLIEYLTGGAPLLLNYHLNNTILRYPRLAYRTDANLVLETSSDMMTWAPVISNRLVETGEFLKKTEVTLTSTAAPRFFRLAARLNTP